MSNAPQKQRLIRDTSSEITVRAYDRQMRDRFDETIKAIRILYDVIDGNQFDNPEFHTQIISMIDAESDIFIKLKHGINDLFDQLQALLTHYDLVTVAYLIDDSNNRQYFAIMSSENIDSQLWLICARIQQHIDQINSQFEKLIPSCQDDSAAPSSRSNKRPPRKATAVASKKEIGTKGPPLAQSLGNNGTAIAVTTTAAAAAESLSKPIIATVTLIKHLLRSASECIDRVINWAQPIYHQGIDVMLCEDCGSRVRIIPEISEAVCDKCGRITVILDSTTDDAGQTCVQDSAIHGRRGGYNYIRHLKIWLDRLQAIENNEFNPADIAKLRSSIESEYVSRSSVNWRALQCRDVIRHLDLCGLSFLGEHVPKLLKVLGGRAPPILDYDSEQIIVRDFMHIMDIYSHLFRETGNKPYYPFFIAKIIRRRFKDIPELFRMLLYVSHQGHETVSKNDRIYRRICEMAPPQYDLIYEPEIE